jgi:hypothetical protein
MSPVGMAVRRAFLGAGQRAAHTPDQPAPDGSARFAQW